VAPSFAALLEPHRTALLAFLGGRIPPALRRKITAEDNIFELGAHSIQLATLLARIESDLGQKIRIEALWDNQTVARLAAHVAAQAAADAPANA